MSTVYGPLLPVHRYSGLTLLGIIRSIVAVFTLYVTPLPTWYMIGCRYKIQGNRKRTLPRGTHKPEDTGRPEYHNTGNSCGVDML